METKKLTVASYIHIDGVTEAEILGHLAVPQDKELADFALPCFRFAKILRKSPQVIAEGLKAEISAKNHPFSAVEAVNGYLNFKFDRGETACAVLNQVLKMGNAYGENGEGNGKTVCIDYSSVNIAKPFHIGHLSTTVIGGALYRIYKKLGYQAIGINHLGDWGTQFGKLIVAFRKWGSEKELKEGGVPALNRWYVQYHKAAELDPTLDDLARAKFKEIEDGKPEAMRLFTLFREITLKEVKKTYERLDIHFDSYNGEAFYNDKMQPILDELKEKGLMIPSDGAEVVDLSADDMPPCLLLRADGATLYATRDLAAAVYRKNTYDFCKCLYVVAYQQNLHFRQVFRVLELMGKPWAKDLEHVAFGMVSMEDGAMSTRKGKVVLLEDVLNRAVEKSLKIIAEKSPDLNDKEKVAEEIGVGAVVFFALSNNRIKDIVFSYDKVLNFDGETGPYVQYTNARCNSILRKAAAENIVVPLVLAKEDIAGIDNTESAALIALLERYPDTLREVLNRSEPSLLTRLLVDIAQAFNKFYLENRILNAEPALQKGRIVLVKATATVLKEGMRLIGMKAPEEM